MILRMVPGYSVFDARSMCLLIPHEKRKPKPSYYRIQVSDLENVRYLRLLGVFDAAPCGCELGFRVYGGQTRIAEVLNFADLKVRTSRVRCGVKSNMPKKPIPGVLNVEICPCLKKDDLQSLTPKAIPVVSKDGRKILAVVRSLNLPHCRVPCRHIVR